MLTVVLKPADAIGFAFVDQQRPGGVAVEYAYIPAVHRVRESHATGRSLAVLRDHFTY